MQLLQVAWEIECFDFFFFRDLCSIDLKLFEFGAKDALELLAFLPLFHECRDYMCVLQNTLTCNGAQ